MREKCAGAHVCLTTEYERPRARYKAQARARSVRMLRCGIRAHVLMLTAYRESMTYAHKLDNCVVGYAENRIGKPELT